MKKHSLYAGIVSVVLMTAMNNAMASGAFSFEDLLNIKESQFERFAAAYEEAIAAAAKAYEEALTELASGETPKKLRKAALNELKRFKQQKAVPEKKDNHLPEEIQALQQTFRKSNMQADQTRLRRTIGVLETHIRELTRLQERLQNMKPDDPQLPEIQAEIDKTRRIRAALK